ncbi:MAG: hypothetical protein LAO03_22905 [Acidobacteriia bacterium]|nr:hypothetical protein [Terriglobia bacterium]
MTAEHFDSALDVDDWQISERVVALKSEVAGLRRAEEVYTKKRQHTPNQALEHVKRMEPGQEILDELTALANRKRPSSR